MMNIVRQHEFNVHFGPGTQADKMRRHGLYHICVSQLQAAMVDAPTSALQPYELTRPLLKAGQSFTQLRGMDLVTL